MGQANGRSTPGAVGATRVSPRFGNTSFESRTLGQAKKQALDSVSERGGEERERETVTYLLSLRTPDRGRRVAASDSSLVARTYS